MFTIKVLADILTIALAGYIIGSFPTSIVTGKIIKDIDIRKYGSGNAGATNTFRVLGWKAGLIVALVDIFKGFAATMWFSKLYPYQTGYEITMFFPIISGAAAVIGHCYTIFAGFKGGKGIAATAGMLIALFPAAFLICLAVFTTVLLSSGYVSLSSLVTALALPISLFILKMVFMKPISIALLIFSLAMCMFVIYTHRSNIKRLIEGTESRFTQFRILVK